MCYMGIGIGLAFIVSGSHLSANIQTASSEEVQNVHVLYHYHGTLLPYS